MAEDISVLLLVLVTGGVADAGNVVVRVAVDRESKSADARGPAVVVDAVVVGAVVAGAAVVIAVVVVGPVVVVAVVVVGVVVVVGAVVVGARRRRFAYCSALLDCTCNARRGRSWSRCPIGAAVVSRLGRLAGGAGRGEVMRCQEAGQRGRC